VSGNSVEITGGLKTVHDVWVSGAKVDVYADGVGLLGTSTTNSNGVFSVNAELEKGEYQVYAEFSDISLPLEESVSEPITVKVSSSFLLPILGVAVLGVAAFIGVRIFRKRKISSIPEAVGFDVNVVRAVTPSPAKGIVKAIRKIISGHAKIEDSDKLRVIYRETISQIASYEKIRDIEVKTPREILSEISMQTSRISSFMTEYEYLHYADVTVSETDLEKMKNLAAEILESYHEENN
jgi:hypothetical protein